ncbi:Uncharacterized membrane protein YphA, DoxX/SURF4 family [Natronoarchaeum philippinense]|uniref:Uncharacterized membrane protein YphA, DoxX/SURF4 family n=2 Tax=Natronoarchaeum philippinense TaxID=558529 RepID=A0A285N5Z5_NATPI|nr:Uncharacterized membrane protein YphA, DoxX/SURF4 family [Natronoarchaeum philippinense]
MTALLVLVQPAAAHVRYVSDDDGGPTGLALLADVLADPLNAALLGGGAVTTLAVALAYLRFRPARTDLAVLRETLLGYRDLVPWMLRLALGLPLVGAGFAGYYFSPEVAWSMRVFQVALGFFLLFGLATRAVAGVGLLAYLVALPFAPDLLLAFEYVPGFIAIVLVGSGRPSADHMLKQVAGTPGTIYGRFDPVYGLADWFDGVVEPYKRYAPTVVRAGLGIAFAYLGIVEKLLAPGTGLAVVEKYNLTAVVPVDPGLWVIGAGLTELALGVALLLGVFTRGGAAVAFVMFTLTLFGLPDDPVLAHVTLYGMVSMLFITGSGPLAVDNWLRETSRDARTSEGEAAVADD